MNIKDADTRERWRFLPREASADAGVLLCTRAMRGFGDGFVSVLLPLHLSSLGLGNTRIGAVVTATLVGSAAVTLGVGLLAHRYPRRALLFRASILMILTGLGFVFVRDFWPLLAVAFLGTMNPSAGDVSVFLPTEQALLPQTVSSSARTSLFARYSLVGWLFAAIGALAAAVPEILEARTSIGLPRAIDLMFLLYSLLGLMIWRSYHALSPAIEPAPEKESQPLTKSRGTVLRLSALFSIDSLGGGFVVQSILALWLFERFDLSVATTGTIFFWTGLCTAFSQLAAPRLAKKIGLIPTMVFTHLPANLFLIATPFMPTLPLAIATLLLRSLVSSMDGPARSSYVMAVVSPEERPAAASITNVPRSLASALGPFPAGYLLGLTTFGWPLIIGGSLKVIYDLLLFAMFQKVKPPEEG